MCQFGASEQCLESWPTGWEIINKHLCYITQSHEKGGQCQRKSFAQEK